MGTKILTFCRENYNEEGTEHLLDESTKVGLEVNAEKTKRVFMSRDQNAGQAELLYNSS
jgi:hypothetical protein